MRRVALKVLKSANWSRHYGSASMSLQLRKKKAGLIKNNELYGLVCLSD